MYSDRLVLRTIILKLIRLMPSLCLVIVIAEAVVSEIIFILRMIFLQLCLHRARPLGSQHTRWEENISVFDEITRRWGTWPRQALKNIHHSLQTCGKRQTEKTVYSGYCENPHPTDSEKWMNSFTNLYSRFHPTVLVRHRCLHEAYKSWHKSVILLREWPAASAQATRWEQRANTRHRAQQCTGKHNSR